MQYSDSVSILSQIKIPHATKVLMMKKQTGQISKIRVREMELCESYYGTNLTYEGATSNIHINSREICKHYRFKTNMNSSMPNVHTEPLQLSPSTEWTQVNDSSESIQLAPFRVCNVKFTSKRINQSQYNSNFNNNNKNNIKNNQINNIHTTTNQIKSNLDIADLVQLRSKSSRAGRTKEPELIINNQLQTEKKKNAKTERNGIDLKNCYLDVLESFKQKE
ncbi:Hypothetical_protein [Hexamita inflata]|uniref:Hypothetical_protein n=1 Tax=Hexamita inflata TaxID=28002 RepID=A0AA86QXH8_9EUKA|nr:Hypothetical protein HINF_LOCUS4612 [Hexamita inflata]CAI9965062.1 Hypothetical protein HINF_LOCUS52707 [Hexamita inflata]